MQWIFCTSQFTSIPDVALMALAGTDGDVVDVGGVEVVSSGASPVAHSFMLLPLHTSPAKAPGLE